jgi:hypothetical protein
MSIIASGTTSGTALVSTGNTNGNLVFQTNGTTTALTLSTAQAATFAGVAQFPTTIGVGNATPSTSGNGITFPSAASMSSNANTLSDYEYGTFTANLGGTETGTFTCNYSKIGNLVTIYGAIAVTSINTGSTTVVSGLPYTINGNGFASFACSYWDNIATAVVFIGALGTNAGTSLTLYSATAATSSGLTANAIFKNSATFRFVGSYITTQA